MEENLYEDVLQQITSNRSLTLQDSIGKLEDLITSISQDKNLEEYSNIFEKTLISLLEKYQEKGDPLRYQELLSQLRTYFSIVPKARTAKLVRIIIQSLRKIPGSLDLQVSLCTEWIEWGKAEERTNLRQRLETELAEIFFQQKRFQDALKILSRISSELRKTDHKSALIEVYLIESRIFRSVGDYNRAKASLTAARTNAAAVYTSPALQGQLDLENGILFTDDAEYKTAISYFTEAFDAFANANDPRAIDALKYGLLCRILDGKPGDCAAVARNAAVVLAGKGHNEHTFALQMDLMLELARASEAKSLHQLKKISDSRKEELETDSVISSSIGHLVESMAEQHLLRIVKPYSAVELTRISEMIQLPVEDVSAKLVLMILDQKLQASIDQSEGILNIFDEEENNDLFTQSLTLLDNVDSAVDALYARSHLVS